MPDPTPDPALLDATARKLGFESADDMSVFKWDLALDLPGVVGAVLSALAAAGRLLPPDTETEWGWLSADTVRVYASLSEANARRAASRSGARKTMRRQVGPWLPVPITTT